MTWVAGRILAFCTGSVICKSQYEDNVPAGVSKARNRSISTDPMGNERTVKEEYSLQVLKE
jgi:hypothetical protein